MKKFLILAILLFSNSYANVLLEVANPLPVHVKVSYIHESFSTLFDVIDENYNIILSQKEVVISPNSSLIIVLLPGLHHLTNRVRIINCKMLRSIEQSSTIQNITNRIEHLKISSSSFSFPSFTKPPQELIIGGPEDGFGCFPTKALVTITYANSQIDIHGEIIDL